MDLKNILEDQMATPLWFFRFPPPLIVVLAPLPILILGFGFYSIFLTSTALLFSTLFFTCSKQKPVQLLETSAEEKVVLKSDNESNDSTQDKEAQEAIPQSPKYLVAPQSSAQDLVAESASLDDSSTSEDSELLDWPFGDNADQSPDFSDGSISDEESLIEISLPDGNYVGQDKEEEPFFCLQQKMSGLSQKAIFQQRTLFEFLAEINEEENMIEIDISMGSIKCSRFEIEA